MFRLLNIRNAAGSYMSLLGCRTRTPQILSCYGTTRKFASNGDASQRLDCCGSGCCSCDRTQALADTKSTGKGDYVKRAFMSAVAGTAVAAVTASVRSLAADVMFMDDPGLVHYVSEGLIVRCLPVVCRCCGVTRLPGGH